MAHNLICYLHIWEHSLLSRSTHTPHGRFAGERSFCLSGESREREREIWKTCVLCKHMKFLFVAFSLGLICDYQIHGIPHAFCPHSQAHTHKNYPKYFHSHSTKSGKTYDLSMLEQRRRREPFSHILIRLLLMMSLFGAESVRENTELMIRMMVLVGHVWVSLSMWSSVTVWCLHLQRSSHKNKQHTHTYLRRFTMFGINQFFGFISESLSSTFYNVLKFPKRQITLFTYPHILLLLLLLLFL